MELISLKTGRLEENCYLLSNQQKETLIFDPGDNGDEIEKLIASNGLLPIAILITHAHSDHIGAVEYIRSRYDIPVYIHPIEKEFLTNAVLNLSAKNGTPIVAREAEYYYPEKMGSFEVGPFQMEIEHIPGHSPGSTVFLFKENGFVIGGDVLFKGSVGRSDLPGGSHATLMDGIRRVLVPLPEETVVFPGHGEPTTIGHEIATNPFLNGRTR